MGFRLWLVSIGLSPMAGKTIQARRRAEWFRTEDLTAMPTRETRRDGVRTVGVVQTAMLLGLALSLLAADAARGDVFTYIRIGDYDGFGFPILNTNGGLKGLTGTNFPTIRDVAGVRLDPNMNLRLDPGEYMPDLNGGGTVAWGGSDEFNYRSAAEAGGAYVEGQGFTFATTGSLTTGSQWTDISITPSYHNNSSNTPGPNFDTGNGGFPEADKAVPNNAFFRFSFSVDKTDILAGATLYLNVIFGDYEVVPAALNLVGANGAFTETIPLQTQTKDGLIQASYVALNFSDVFVDDGDSWKGMLEVTFNAPNEPYYALDCVELGINLSLIHI